MNAQRLSAVRREVIALLRLPAELIARGLELLVSRRGMAMLFAGIAALLASSTWVRAPLNLGLCATHIPLASLFGVGPVSIELLDGPRVMAWDSLGAALLAYTALGAAIMLWRPRWLRPFAGILLVLAVAGNAMIACNQPGLLELLASENDQRYQIAQVLRVQKEDCLTSPTNGCVPYDGPRRANTASPLHAWTYLAYGVWMAALAMAGVFFGGRRSIAGRFQALAIWSALAAAAAAACCVPRLRAEYWWYCAARDASEADFAASRQAMENAIRSFPPLAPLRRTWLLKGELDFEEGIFSPEQRLWTASQLAARKDVAAANAVMQRLVTECTASAVAQQTADLLAIAGRKRIDEDDWGAAAEAFEKAAAAAPWRLDTAFYLGMIDGRCDRHHPEQTETRLARLLVRCADRGLCADLLSMLGDVYFEDEKLVAARDHYDQSFRLFNLPMTINYRAQKGLGGM